MLGIKSLIHKKVTSIHLVFLCVICSVNACVTDNAGVKELPPPPTISSDTKMSDALIAAVDYGSTTMSNVKRIIINRQEQAKSSLWLEEYITKNADNPNASRNLINAMNLYISFVAEPSRKLFNYLVANPRTSIKDLGWHLAYSMPSKIMAADIDSVLTKSLQSNTEDSILSAKMADAVKANRVKEAYTFLRRGLFLFGDEAYVSAMIMLDPKAASNDLMLYLSQASAEDLRQMNQTEINAQSAVMALRHIFNYPVTVANASFDHLFLYAVSRNSILSELANAVLENNYYSDDNRAETASVLARMPEWVQVAYLENIRRDNTSARLHEFLREFKTVATNANVLDDLKDLSL